MSEKNNLSENENKIFKIVEMLEDYLKSSNTEVFSARHYLEFREGNSSGILIVRACAKSK